MKLNSLPSKLRAAAGLSVAVLLTGCFDTKQDFTLNPDGSGKVVHQSTFQGMDLDLGGAKPDPQQALLDAVRKVLEESKGVDAWRDVTYKRVDDQHVFFRGTAYFKDLSKLDIPNQTLLDFEWQKQAGGKLILSLRTNKDEADAGLTVQKKPASTAKLSPADQAAKIKEDRAKYEEGKPMMAAILGSMKQEALFHLPGKVSQSANFQTDPSGALKINFSGAKLLEAMDKLVSDDAWMLKNGDSGVMGDPGQKPGMDEDMNGMLFGTKAPVEAVITGPTAPLFDYAAEVAAAKLDFAKTEKELALSPGSLAPPAQGEALKNLRVVGVQLVTESDQKRNLLPFNTFDAGYKLALCADFSGAVLAVADKSALDTAVADNGDNLLPERQFDRAIHFPRLSNDKTSVVFEVALRPPGKGVSGVKELSGHLGYSVASGTKNVDLGIEEIKEGAKGTEFGAQIVTIKEGWQKNGSQDMQLKLNLGFQTIKSVSLVADGNKTALQQGGSMSDGKTSTITYSYKQAYPAKARLELEMFDNVQTFEVPFKLENITLLGGQK
jgi:hypothetical protein